MTADFRALCAELADRLENAITWQKADASYDEDRDAIDRARALLAQPEPPAHPALKRYGVTWDGSPDKPLLTLMADGYWTPWHVAAELLQPPAAGEVAELVAWLSDHELDELSNYDWEALRTRAAELLKRLAPPQPIPVGERLPEAGDCDAEGRVWAWDWLAERWGLWPHPSVAKGFYHWLPAHALSLPSGEVS